MKVFAARLAALPLLALWLSFALPLQASQAQTEGEAASATGPAGLSSSGQTLALPASLWAGGASAVVGRLGARVAMRKVKYARTLSEVPLPLPDSLAAWPAGERRREALLAPSAGQAGKGVDIHAFNEARLDYLTASRDNPGCLAFKAELAGGEAVFVSDPLETVDRLTPDWADGQDRDAVAVAGGQWAEKSARYLLSRFLDREPDAVWRYAQDGLSTFVQRRFRKDLTDVGALDVVLSRGQDVQVNLVVALDPARPKERTVLDWYALEKRFFDLGDGRRILRLYVGRHLRELYPGAKGVALKELALMFFRENQEDVLRNRNVEKILFVPSGLDPDWLARNGLPRHLPARMREVFAGRGELSANLQALQSGAWKAMPLTGLSVLQSPQDAARPFTQTLESARLANMAPRRDAPALLAATEERCKTFGAACDIDDPNGLVGQDPLWSLDFTPFARGLRSGRSAVAGAAGTGGSAGAAEAAGATGVAREASATGATAAAGMGGAREPAPGGSSGEFTWGDPLDPLAGNGPGQAIGVAGAEALFASAQRPRFSSDADGLLVEGRSGELVMETGAAFSPEPGRTYSLWLEMGRRRTGLKAVTAEARGNGKTVRVAVKPGFPMVFPELPAKVEGVRLRFVFDGPEYAVSLRQAVLQSTPKSPARQNLFEARYLFDETIPLAVARQTPRQLALTPAGKLSANSLNGQWLLLDLATQGWTVNDPAPAVDVALGDRRITVPLTSPSGRVAVYLPALSSSEALAAPEPSGRSRTAGTSPGGQAGGGECPPMVATLRGGAPGAGLACGRASLSGQHLATWPDILAADPLLSLDGRQVSLSTLDPAQAGRMAATNSWRMLSRVELPAGGPPVHFFRSPWLEVEALLLAHASGPELAALAVSSQNAPAGGQSALSAMSATPATPATSSKSGKWWALAACLALAAVGWLFLRQGRLERGLAGIEAWLCRSRDRQGRPLPFRAWLLAGSALAAASFFMGMGAARQGFMFSAFLAIPLWRAGRARMAFAAKRLANNPVLYYCLGFLLAAGIGTVLRLARLTAVSELFGLMGLALFFVAVFLHLRSLIGSDTCAGSSNRTF